MLETVAPREGVFVTGAFIDPRWTAETRQLVDRSKPAISRAAGTTEFYFVPLSVRKSVCTLANAIEISSVT